MHRFEPYRQLMAIRNVRWLVVAQCLSQMAFYSSVVVAFESGRGLNFAQMFWLESILSAALIAFEISTGVLADRLGFRRMISLGLGLCFGSHVLFAMAHSFPVFAVSSGLYGAGLACLSGCDSAMLFESLPAGERERLSDHAFALVSAASSFGFFAGLAWAASFGLQGGEGGSGPGAGAGRVGRPGAGIGFAKAEVAWRPWAQSTRGTPFWVLL